MKKMTLSALRMNGNAFLSKDQMKNVTGGGPDPDPYGPLCLRCNTDLDCASVGKGICVFYPGACSQYCCSGWQEC